MSRTPEQMDRLALVVERRRERVSFEAIGAELGVSKQRAHQLYDEAVLLAPVRHLEAHRAEELDLYDEAVRDLLKLARDETTDPKTRISAWDSINRWSSRKAKFLGLDAPTRIDGPMFTMDAVEAEIARLERALAAAAEEDVAGI